MDSSNELLEEEEDVLVYVEFEGFVNNDLFTNRELQLDMIGIDTDHPIMHINGRCYEGTYEDAIGTYMFFDRDDKPVIDDPIFDQVPTLKYFGKTRKVLKMRRVFVKQRVEVLGDSEHSKCIPNIDTIKEAGVPPMYQSEALSFWNNIRDKRINDLCAYLEKQKIREEKKSQGIELNSESDEDNPFAIYKYKEDIKDNQNLDNFSIRSSFDDADMSPISQTNSSKKIMDNVIEHIHSKPSTSKTNDSFVEMNHKIRIPTKVVCRKKGLTVRSKLTKKHKKKSTIVDEENEFIQNCDDDDDDNDFDIESRSLNPKINDSDKNIETNNLVDIVQDNTNTNNSDIKDNVTTDNDINTDINTIETQVKTTDTTVVEKTIDKKHAKLLKREAKMKELSKKMKSLVEESAKANVNQ